MNLWLGITSTQKVDKNTYSPFCVTVYFFSNFSGVCQAQQATQGKFTIAFISIVLGERPARDRNQ